MLAVVFYQYIAYYGIVKAASAENQPVGGTTVVAEKLLHLVLPRDARRGSLIAYKGYQLKGF